MSKIEIRVQVAEIKEPFVKDDFVKTELIGVTDSKEFPQVYKFEFVKKNQELLKQLEVGDFVTITSNLRGRSNTNEENEKAYFLSLDAWKVTNIRK